MTDNPIIGFQVNPADIQYIGNDLQRPECILAEPDGTLWSADARGGVVRISPDGSQKIITQAFGESLASGVRGFPISNRRWRDCPWYTGGKGDSLE